MDMGGGDCGREAKPPRKCGLIRREPFSDAGHKPHERGQKGVNLDGSQTFL